MKTLHRSCATGFGLVELMIAMALGLVVSAGVIVIFLAERQVYNTSSSQSLMQDTDNAISAIVTPIVRGAGFLGCGTVNDGNVNDPSVGASSSLVFNAYDAVQGFTGTLPATLQDGASNDTSSGDWSPSLDSSIVDAGGAEQGSDVIVLMGAAPYATPIGLPDGVTTSPFAVDDATQLVSGAQMVAVSNCGSSTVFQVTSVSGLSVSYSTGPTGTPAYQAGSQLIPLQQTMFFVGKGDGGQSGLFEGVMTIPSGGTAASAKWETSEIVPGVVAMKVLYGIAVTSGSNTQYQYVDASEVTDWSDVASVEFGFLVEGGIGSAPMPSGPTNYQLFNDTLTVPADTRMRHVYYMTINVRNSTL